MKPAIPYTNLNIDYLANKFNPFFDFFAEDLETYCSLMAKSFSWGVLDLLLGDLLSNKELDHLKFVPYWHEEDDEEDNNLSFYLDLFQVFNVEESNHIFYPIKLYKYKYKSNAAVSLICVKNKTDFLTNLNLEKPELLYSNYPLLLGMLCNGIEFCGKNWPLYMLSIDKNQPVEEQAAANVIYALQQDIRDSEKTAINDFNLNLITNFLENNFLPHLSFFHSISDFSYEGNRNNGYIEFCSELNTITETILFSNTLTLKQTNPKFLRKILEMTEENNSLLVSKPHIQGLNLFRSDWNLIGLGHNNSNTIATAHFMGSSKWQLYTDTELINYDGKTFTIRIKNVPSDETDYDTFIQFYKTIIDWEEHYTKFLDIYNYLTKQKHGTMLVVSKKAKQEAERLCNANRGIKIEPIDISVLDKDKLLQLSRIDGAILIDPNCICYALGVILDGIVEPSFKGDPGRGARYNSAKLYIHNIKTSLEMNAINTYTKEYADDAMVVVISEDGYIDAFSSTEDT